jgi:hypothetical protein
MKRRSQFVRGISQEGRRCQRCGHRRDTQLVVSPDGVLEFVCLSCLDAERLDRVLDADINRPEAP